MRLLIPLVSVLWSSFVFANPAMILQQSNRFVADAEGGPDAYYYGGVSTSVEASTNDGNDSSDHTLGDDITVPEAGDITEICCVFPDHSDSGNIRIGLYYDVSGTWTRHEGITTSYDSGDDGRVCYTLTSSYEVDEDETIWIIYGHDGGFPYAYGRTSGGHYGDFDYVSNLPATITISPEWEYGVAVYVD